ncbi:6-phosphogluconolactonase [Parvularcula sp. ZS-1/3]|uniref:6-phosphogluconolactonase n=1 Tax=Parvularcula mediterranea TaxID=2732508 RepID=A0A7Y3RK85_9PROT|nr:6-phosphogluconolactonase [Parvularcula mediterranea]NNU15614.1 6-phosphogluconolactonase [Parvularcula mediterranea]
MNDLTTFDTRVTLIERCAEHLASAIKAAIEKNGVARVALSGGSTPGPVYELLSRDNSVDWPKVEVTLADERLTPPGHEASNETLVRKTLLQNEGAKASFFHLDDQRADFPKLDVVFLGMGPDGHFASLFPGAAELPAALAGDAPDVMRVVPDPMPAHAPFERATLSLRAILETPTLLLAITGDEKRAVFEEAQQPGPAEELPIRALLRAEHPNLSIYWAH